MLECIPFKSERMQQSRADGRKVFYSERWHVPSQAWIYRLKFNSRLPTAPSVCINFHLPSPSFSHDPIRAKSIIVKPRWYSRSRSGQELNYNFQMNRTANIRAQYSNRYFLSSLSRYALHASRLKSSEDEMTNVGWRSDSKTFGSLQKRKVRLTKGRVTRS